ncbi:band 4.1-like protein 4 [Pholidichthys leucotaenia]
MACFRGNREEFYGEVLLLDDRKLTLTVEQGIKRSSKSADVLQLVFSHLNLIQVEFFGLRFCDDKQQTHWLVPSKTLSQHRDLRGPPYIFYFGVKFYIEDPSELKEETTQYQFYLQLRQDIYRGRLPCSTRVRARLSAFMLQVEQGDYGGDDASESEEKQDVERIYKSLKGVSQSQAQGLFLSLCSSLNMYGVSLFAAYGENHTEYFLGPAPVGVVVYKNKELVGKYFWQRITKLHFKDETFELRVIRRNGSETSFFFQTSDRYDCQRLWKCCIEHHTFFSFYGNTSSGSESEKTGSNRERQRRKTRTRSPHSDHGPDYRRRRHRSYSPDAEIWKHIKMQQVEPDGLMDRQMEEIPYKEVRVLGEPIRTRVSQRHQRSEMTLLPPLPVTMTTDVSLRSPTSS